MATFSSLSSIVPLASVSNKLNASCSFGFCYFGDRGFDLGMMRSGDALGMRW